MRVRSDKPTSNNGYLHILRDDDFTPHIPQPPRPQPPPVETPRIADVDTCHHVYVDLLRAHLVLSGEHRANLRARGLSDLAIEFHGYKSAPTNIFAANIARALSKDFDLTGIPGFFRERGEWRLNFTEWHQGIIVAVKDTRARIRGLMVRRDAPDKPKYVWLTSKDKPDGASPGAPPHFARVDVARASGKIIVTEGSLKANVISELTGESVVGIAGVANFSERFGADLRRAIPELKSVVVAYDADFRTNEAVRRGMTKLRQNLNAAGLSVSVRVWDANEGKGFDDVLAAAKGVA
jgi:DNA primase